MQEVIGFVVWDFFSLNWVEFERIKAMLSVSQLYELSHKKKNQKKTK